MPIKTKLKKELSHSIAALHVEEPLASQLLPCVFEADSALKPTTDMWAILTSFVSEATNGLPKCYMKTAIPMMV